MADEVKTTEQPEVLEGKMAEFATWLETITVMDLLKLVKALEKKFGVSAAIPTAAMAAGVATAPGAQAAGKKEEEQTEFTVILSEIGPQKIQVIKEIRAITGLGLQESKALVEGAPKPVKEGVSKEEALKLKEKLEAAGAKAEIK